MELKNLILTTSTTLLLILSGTFCHPVANWKISRGNQTCFEGEEDPMQMENTENATRDDRMRDLDPEILAEDRMQKLLTDLFHRKPITNKNGQQVLNTTTFSYKGNLEDTHSGKVRKREIRPYNTFPNRDRSIVDKTSENVVGCEDNDQITAGIDSKMMKKAQDEADKDLMNGLQMLLTKHETLEDVFRAEKYSGFSNEEPPV